MFLVLKFSLIFFAMHAYTEQNDKRNVDCITKIFKSIGLSTQKEIGRTVDKSFLLDFL